MSDSAKAEYDVAVAQQNLYFSQLTLAVADVVMRYISAEANYNPGAYDVLINQLSIAEAAYKHGDISELELLRQRASIQEQLYNYYEASVVFCNAIKELELLEQGVLVN